MELVLIVAVIALVVRAMGPSKREHLPESRATGWSPDTRWQVVAPLARRELWMIVRHPAFIAGVVLTPLVLMAATADASSWRFASTGIALGLVPLGWMTIIAVNLVALRSRRNGTDELFSTLAAPQPVRTTALLAAAVGPAVVATVLAVGWVILLRGDSELDGAPLWDEIAAGLLIVVGSVAVGVAVARWIPHAGFGVFAAIATMILQARFLDVRTWPWDRPEGDSMRFLGFLAQPTSVAADFLEVRPAKWHLVYVGGLIVVMAGVALAREGLRRTVAAVLVVGLVAAGVAGWAQTRPLSETQVDAMVSYLLQPEQHQTCVEAATARLCAYPGFEDDVAKWVDRVDATLGALPATALAGRERLEVMQRPAVVMSNADCRPRPFENSLPPGVAARLSRDGLWPDDGRVHPPFGAEGFPCSDRDTHGFFLSVQVAAWAVGLPPATHGNFVRCVADGQSRTVITLWAASATTTDGTDTLADLIREGTSDGARLDFPDWDDPPVWGVRYSVADARLALAMLDVPAADVREVLSERWEHWVAPGTPSTDLAGELGLATVGPTAAGGTPCS